MNEEIVQGVLEDDASESQDSDEREPLEVRLLGAVFFAVIGLPLFLAAWLGAYSLGIDLVGSETSFDTGVMVGAISMFVAMIAVDMLEDRLQEVAKRVAKRVIDRVQ